MNNKIMNKSKLSHLISIYRKQGFVYIISLLVLQIRLCKTTLFGEKIFLYKSSRLKYYRHYYNRTWLNERCLELAIGLNFIKEIDYSDVLEVGNVLSHYVPVKHDVVDKYEKSTNVKNIDVVDYHPNKKYKRILALSTLEHVGWDEETKDPDKFSLAIKNLKTLLEPNGILLVTLPIGYNHILDQ